LITPDLAFVAIAATDGTVYHKSLVVKPNPMIAQAWNDLALITGDQPRCVSHQISTAETTLRAIKILFIRIEFYNTALSTKYKKRGIFEKHHFCLLTRDKTVY
jgi:hypothetical protein